MKLIGCDVHEVPDGGRKVLNGRQAGLLVGPQPQDVAALFDLHVHTLHSPDGRGTLKELAHEALGKGLQGFATTDHNTLRMAPEIRRFKSKDLLIIPGMEVSTRAGHCLALGVQSEVPRNLDLAETLEAIQEAGGVGVPSHPFRLIHGVGRAELDRARRLLRGVEVFNARDGPSRSNDYARDYAEGIGLGGTGGSDAHQVFELGNAYTLFPELPATVDDVLRMLRRKVTWGGGQGTPRSQLVRQNAKNAWLWLRRGMRSI